MDGLVPGNPKVPYAGRNKHKTVDLVGTEVAGHLPLNVRRGAVNLHFDPDAADNHVDSRADTDPGFTLNDQPLGLKGASDTGLKLLLGRVVEPESAEETSDVSSGGPHA